MIQIENLTKSFGSKLVLDHINLSFVPGKVYGIVGENGAGKTTFFKCMTGIESYEGKITADTMPLKDEIAYLQTDPFFFSKITGMEYIRLLCNARGNRIDDIESKNIFNLPLQQYASSYSTGMKKKLALTAILLQHNKYYILDEPFNGVDIQSNILITEIFKELKRLNKTLIISSHIFSTLSELCDEIYLLNEGQFSAAVQRDEFANLENDMKKMFVGNKIEGLRLQ